MSDIRPPSAFSNVPPVVKNLVIINVLVYVAQVVFDTLLHPGGGLGPMMRWGALWPSGAAALAASQGTLVPAFWPWQIVTSAFMHGSIWHIGFNMFALFSIGPPVEQAMGSKRFAIFYGVCVLGSGLLQLAIVSYPFWAGTGGGAIGPTLGASGGVLGVVTAFGMLYPLSRLFIFPIPFPIEARWLVPGAAVISLVLGVTGWMPGIAHFAHLGGMVAGALLVLYWKHQQRTRTLA